MTVSALLIADYLICVAKSPLTVMKLNKLAYISHGFTLAIEGEQLFRDRVEAWKYGPVISSLYHALKEFGSEYIQSLPYCGTDINEPNLKERLKFTTSNIPKQHRAIVDRVMDVYGGYSGLGLSTITHTEGSPWHQCYKEGEFNIVIPDAITEKYYKQQTVQSVV